MVAGIMQLGSWLAGEDKSWQLVPDAFATALPYASSMTKWPSLMSVVMPISGFLRFMLSFI